MDESKQGVALVKKFRNSKLLSIYQSPSPREKRIFRNLSCTRLEILQYKNEKKAKVNYMSLLKGVSLESCTLEIPPYQPPCGYIDYLDTERLTLVFDGTFFLANKIEPYLRNFKNV